MAANQIQHASSVEPQIMCKPMVRVVPSLFNTSRVRHLSTWQQLHATNSWHQMASVTNVCTLVQVSSASMESIGKANVNMISFVGITHTTSTQRRSMFLYAMSTRMINKTKTCSNTTKQDAFWGNHFQRTQRTSTSSIQSSNVNQRCHHHLLRINMMPSSFSTQFSPFSTITVVEISSTASILFNVSVQEPNKFTLVPSKWTELLVSQVQPIMVSMKSTCLYALGVTH